MHKSSEIVKQIEAIVHDPSASDLLRFLCAKNLSRDPCDAASELEIAAGLFGELASARLTEMRGLLENAQTLEMAETGEQVVVHVLPDGTLAI